MCDSDKGYSIGTLSELLPLFFGVVSDARRRIISLIMRHQIARLGSKRDDWQLSNYSPSLLLSPKKSFFDVPENRSSKFVASAAPSRFGHFVRAIYRSFVRSSTSDLRGALCKYHAHGPGKRSHLNKTKP